jgi:hypothetical protein
MSNTPTLSEVLRTAIAAQQTTVFTALPAQVESYDSTKQKAIVQPLLKRGYQDEADERQVESLPAISDVPVIFPGAGEISITWPIAAGATGLLVFTSGSLDKWKSKGGEVDPGDDRRNTLSDAVFIPGLRPFSAPVESGGLHSTALVVSAPLIHAGGSSSLAFNSALNAVASRLAAVEAAVALEHPASGVSEGADSYSGTSVLKGS